jgi:hypothetical protein
VAKNAKRYADESKDSIAWCAATRRWKLWLKALDEVIAKAKLVDEAQE